MADTDLDTLARSAGTAVRDEVAGRALRPDELLGAARHRRERRRSVAAGGLVALVLLVGAVVLGPLLGDDGPRIDAIGSDEDQVRGVLDVPPDGEVAAAWLDDGTPVFVSAVEDDVLVFDPVMDERRWVPSLAVYCAPAFDPPLLVGSFQGPQHGERWDWRGHWLDGPATTDLARYEVRAAGDGRVEVLGAPIAADGRSEVPDRLLTFNCFDTTYGDLVDATVRHRPEEGAYHHARDLPANRWSWVYVRVASIRGELRVCDDRCVDGDPTLATPVDMEPPTEPRLYLARPTGDGGVELIEQVVEEDRDPPPPSPDERSWARRTWDGVDPYVVAVLGAGLLLLVAVVGPVRRSARRQRSVSASGGRPRGPRGPSS
jgi:hypothetical protein